MEPWYADAAAPPSTWSPFLLALLSCSHLHTHMHTLPLRNNTHSHMTRSHAHSFTHMHAHTSTHSHIHTQPPTHTHPPTPTHTLSLSHTHTHTHTYTHTHTHTDTHTHTHTHRHTHAHTLTHTHVCTYVAKDLNIEGEQEWPYSTAISMPLAGFQPPPPISLHMPLYVPQCMRIDGAFVTHLSMRERACKTAAQCLDGSGLVSPTPSSCLSWCTCMGPRWHFRFNFNCANVDVL